MNHETLMAQGPVECRVRPLVVVQTVWVQVSADCDTVARTRTLAVTPETTIGEVMRWAAAGMCLGAGMLFLQSKTMRPNVELTGAAPTGKVRTHGE